MGRMKPTEYMPIFRNIHYETGVKAREINANYIIAKSTLAEICTEEPTSDAIQAQAEHQIMRYKATSDYNGISLAPLAVAIIKLSNVFYR